MLLRNFIAKSKRNSGNQVACRLNLAENFVLKALWLSNLFCLLSLVSVFGQNAQHTENKADQTLRGTGGVNPSTLAMEFNVPLSSYPGRGINIPVGLSYSSKVWRMEFNNLAPIPNSNNCKSIYKATFGENSASGWTSSMGAAYVEYTGSDNLFNGDNGNPLSQPCDINGLENTHNGYVRRIQVHLPGGESHEMRMDDEPKIYRRDSNCANQYVPACDQNDVNLRENWTGWYQAVDGSNLKYYENRFDGIYYLLLPDGSRYNFSANAETTAYEDGSNSIRKATSYTDRNNNQIIYHPTDADHPNGYWTDTMGRDLNVPLPSKAPTATGVQDYVLPGLGANTVTYKFHWKKLQDTTPEESALTDFNQVLKYTGDWTGPPVGSPIPPPTQRPATESLFHSGTKEWVTHGSDKPPFNPILLTAIEMPNGQKYRFTYNVYGEIDRIHYPTGGAEEFIYEEIPALTKPNDDNKPVEESNRGVKDRKVYETPGAGTPIHSTYDATYVAPSGYKVSVTNPDGMTTDRFLFQGTSSTYGNWGYGNGLAGMAYEERTFSAPDAQGVQRLINSKLTHWVKKSFGIAAGSNSNADWHPRADNEESFVYDADGSTHLSANIKYEYEGDLNQRETPLLVRKTTQYAFRAIVPSGGNAPASSPMSPIDPPDPNPTPVPTPLPASLTAVRIAETTYLINDPNVPQADRDVYSSQNMSGLPTVIISRNSAGVIIAQSKIKYDETGSSPNVGRGNATTNQTWDSTKGLATDPNAYVLTSAKFDSYGNQIEATDANGNVTTTEFSSAYNYAYSTKVTTAAPDPSPSQNSDGLSHGSSKGFFSTTTYDFDIATHQGTGLPLTTTDANGLETQMEYNDSLLRPSKVITPNGQQTTTQYENQQSGWVKVRTQLDSVNWKEAITYRDGLGRAKKTELVDLGGNIYTETQYDNAGRARRTSNPFRLNDPKLWNLVVYDDAGRIKETFAPAPDGQTGASLGTIDYSISTVSNSVGVVVTTTDAAGKKSRSIKNSIDQLIRVDEATGNNDLGVISAPNQATYYSYNPLGKMVKVQQGDQYRYFLHDSMGRLLKVRQPEQIVNPALTTDNNPDNNSWTAGFTYDNNGNALTATDAKNTTTTNVYDKLNRVKLRSYSDSTPQVSYFYDGVYYDATGTKLQATGGAKGALTQVRNSVSISQTIAFDGFGRALTYQQRTDGQTHTSQYQYRLTGGLAQETYPSGRVVKYEANANGNLLKVSEPANANSQEKIYAESFVYTASGATERLKLGNGKWETAKFNNRLQITELGVGSSATDTSLWKVNYDYGEIDASGNLIAANNNGNLAKQTISFAGLTHSFVQTYKYDALNRLTEAKETSNQTQTWIQNFGYDRFGNRNNLVKTIGNQQSAIDNHSLPTVDPDTNRFATGQGYTYDSNGNVVTDADGRQFTFNGDNKQIEVRDVNNFVVGTYYYDGDGKRIKKIAGSETTVFVYSGGKLAAEYSTQISQNPKISYTTTDSLGSPRLITDQNGSVISRRDFMPFGEDLGAGIGGRTGEGGHKYSSSQDNVRQKFTGYQKDEETQLDFAEARYYNNRHGRFTAVDPLLASGKSSNPQTFNRYIYVMNNPLNLTDPSGMLPVYSRVHNGNTEYSTVDHSKDSGWTVFEGNITVDALDGNRYSIDSNGITLHGNTKRLDTMLASFVAGMMRDNAVGGAKGSYNFGIGIVNSPVTTPIVPAFAPFADTSLEGLFGVPRFFDRYAYTTTGEAIYGYGAEGALTIASFFVGGAAATAGKAASATDAISTTRIFSSRVLLRSAEDAGPFHNFPLSFDKTIFNQGTRTLTPNYFTKPKIGLSNDNILYKLPGEINGKSGVFEIGVRPSTSGNTEVIMHRFFNPKP
jgi:RHS repeat-associated protein